MTRSIALAGVLGLWMALLPSAVLAQSRPPHGSLRAEAVLELNVDRRMRTWMVNGHDPTILGKDLNPQYKQLGLAASPLVVEPTVEDCAPGFGRLGCAALSEPALPPASSPLLFRFGLLTVGYSEEFSGARFDIPEPITPWTRTNLTLEVENSKYGLWGGVVLNVTFGDFAVPEWRTLSAFRQPE